MSPLPAWCLPLQANAAGTFYAATRCGIPACLRIHTAQPLQPGLSPLHDLFSPRSLKQPLGLLPLCGNVPVPPFARKGCRRRPQAPAQKKRNFLDLWQTIAQDLSRLFAVPGGCPSCPGSRKDCPSPCPASAAPCPLRVCGRSLPESALRCLAGTRCTCRHGQDDTAGAYALPPCRPTTAPGDRSGMAARGAATQSMDLNKKFWQG